jgi:DNA-directed RNA polymerase subunit omega
MAKTIKAKIRMEDLLERSQDRFMLTLGVARRGRQLVDGANPLVSYSEPKLPIIIALSEVQQDRIKIIKQEEAES